MPTRPAVLISDDDAGIRNLLRTVAEKTGCRVETAANGLEAMQKMQVVDFDLLVLDLMMPVMDGFQVAEQMKSIARRPAVIVVTAGTSERKSSIGSTDTSLAQSCASPSTSASSPTSYSPPPTPCTRTGSRRRCSLVRAQ